MANPDAILSDLAELVQRVRASDEAAARALIDHLYPLVLKLVRSHRPRRTAEEDLCQIVFARIFHRFDQFRGTVPLEHWVSRITINACLNHIEAERIRPELRHADLDEIQVEVLARLSATPAELPDEQQEAASEIVGALLDQLSPQDRLVITLLHLEERSVDEIRAVTGWSRALVKVRAFRARQKLRTLYKKLLDSQRHAT